MYGSRCVYLHETRDFDQIHRHYYVTKLYALESQYKHTGFMSEFDNTYESDSGRLPIFKDIHTLGCQEYEDNLFSFNEVEEDVNAFCDPEIKSQASDDEESALNTTADSLGHTSADYSEMTFNNSKNERKFQNFRENEGCFDIAAQLNLSHVWEKKRVK